MKEKTTAESLIEVAHQIKNLGNGNASSHMGAIEFLSVNVGKVADAINNLADAVRESGRR